MSEALTDIDTWGICRKCGSDFKASEGGGVDDLTVCTSCADMMAPAGDASGVFCVSCGDELSLAESKAEMDAKERLCASCENYGGLAPGGSEVHPAVKIREEHIKQEEAIRKMGMVFVIGGIGNLVGALWLFTTSFVSGAGETAVWGAVLGFISCGLLYCGPKMRVLDPKGRTVGQFMSVCLMVSLGLGTLIGIYTISLLVGPAADTLFSPEYKKVISSTPGMKYRASQGAHRVTSVILLLFAFLFSLVLWANWAEAVVWFKESLTDW